MKPRIYKKFGWVLAWEELGERKYISYIPTFGIALNHLAYLYKHGLVNLTRGCMGKNEQIVQK